MLEPTISEQETVCTLQEDEGAVTKKEEDSYMYYDPYLACDYSACLIPPPKTYSK